HGLNRVPMSRRMAKAGGGTFTPPGLRRGVRRRALLAVAVGLFLAPGIQATDPEVDSLRPGLVAEYRSLVDPTATLSRIDAKPAFSREPWPAWNLKHSPADETAAVQADNLAEAGRIAIGQLGCARCHASAFPGVSEAPPGPSLADVGRRISKAWLLEWLADPAK